MLAGSDRTRTRQLTETPNVVPAAPAPPFHSSKPACTEVMNHAVLRAGLPLAGFLPVLALRPIASVMNSLMSNSGMELVVCWRRNVITGGLAPGAYHTCQVAPASVAVST